MAKRNKGRKKAKPKRAARRAPPNRTKSMYKNARRAVKGATVGIGTLLAGYYVVKAIAPSSVARIHTTVSRYAMGQGFPQVIVDLKALPGSMAEDVTSISSDPGNRGLAIIGTAVVAATLLKWGKKLHLPTIRLPFFGTRIKAV